MRRYAKISILNQEPIFEKIYYEHCVYESVNDGSRS